MYFPYLHGKQKEVLALRHLAPTLGPEGQVQPIVEPVRQAVTSLRHTLEACEAHRQQVWLVVNPLRQDFEHLPPLQALDWGRNLFTSLPQRQWIHPTLMLGPALTPEVVRRFVHIFGTRPVGVVVGSDAPPLADVMALLARVPVRRVFFKDSAPAPLARAAAGDAGCVWIEERRLPEAQQLRTQERHFFSDRHLGFGANGEVGFSDYTTLPSRPDVPELSSRTVSFRLSYLHRDRPEPGAVWIEHFMGGRFASDERGADARFQHALQSFRKALDRRDSCFGPTEAVRRYLSSMIDRTPPSRALSKQWEVMHHLELMSGVLAGRFPTAFPALVPAALLARSAQAQVEAVVAPQGD
ncbi:hypothetical protein CDN99_19505 [Roseateles aquatilis]|uniref:Uncharacterized protein n=1 Tax=Roseateles aquatilis TaxID=431061 RepID=A0A246J2S0_9BURK|nr:sce7725 family protein [Roseateles aquatilis]OWQ86897.1 hypothetical protein CDN99_19505 [Roseateles aquatilis]